MKKLSDEEKDARINVYDEVIDHMDMEIYDNKIERKQGMIIKKQLIRIRENFINNFINRKNK
jgi:hypothetical protein